MFCVSTLGRGVECCFVLRASVLFECKFSVLAPFCVVRRGDGREFSYVWLLSVCSKFC